MASSSEGTAKNVILLITDGAGHYTWDAASYWRHGELGQEVYDDFEVARYMSTEPLNTATEPTFSVQPEVGYDPEQAWSDEPSDEAYGDYPPSFEGYDYIRAEYTDSAAAGTAIAAGQKTYNNAINTDNFGNLVVNIGELAVESGRELGVVTSVPFPHATPAAFVAHNPSRNDYEGIAAEMIEGGLATVIMGPGHPFYDNDGNPLDEPVYQYVGEETLGKVLAGETDYTFIDSREDFEALADGTLAVDAGEKVLGIPRVAATLQYNREGEGMDPLIEGVPDLATMTTGALRVLEDDEDGFFLMAEGGAVDWAAHANNLDRVIEEQVDFNLAVEAAVDWVEANSSWDETLVIVTTDHGNGLLLGPDSDTEFFQPIVNQGEGELPLVQWHTGSHTNEVVRIWAEGAGAEMIAEMATREDPGLVNYGVPEEVQSYLDNTELFDAMIGAMGIEQTELGQIIAEPIDWDLLAARVTANQEATGAWFV